MIINNYNWGYRQQHRDRKRKKTIPLVGIDESEEIN